METRKDNEINSDNKENQESEGITISLPAEFTRMKNLLIKQVRMGVISEKEYYYFKNYYILNLTLK